MHFSLPEQDFTLGVPENPSDNRSAGYAHHFIVFFSSCGYILQQQP